MELKYKAKNVYKEGTDKEQINSFCEGYKSFLNSCRTERLCAEQAQKAGGGRLYQIQRREIKGRR